MDENIRVISSSPVRLQYYIPFRFDDNRFDTVSEAFSSARKDGAALWEKSRFPLGDNTFIYDHVMSLMNVRESANSVCRSWRLAVPDSRRYAFVLSKTEEFPFSFTEVYAHLFRTGIGMLGCQVMFDCRDLTSGQLVSFQQGIRQLRYTSRNICVLRDSPETAGEGKDAKPAEREHAWLGGMAARLLRERTSPDIEFFGETAENRVPSAALLFSYLCYDCPDPDALREITVHMGLGYNRQRVQSRESIQSCRELTGSVYFHVAPGGCAVSVCPNDLNRHFFVEHPPTASYHFIFFIALYQHYSLLNFTMRISTDFPSDTRAYLQNSDYADRMRDYITDIDTFLMKNDLATISHIQYHNRFYAACREALHIEEDKQSLRSGFESLVNIQQSIQITRQRERWHDQQEEEEKQNRRINIIAIILAVLTVFPEFGNLLNILLTKDLKKLETSDWISIGLFLLTLGIVAVLLVLLWRTKAPEGREK
jgi:hypothetical protein